MAISGQPGGVDPLSLSELGQAFAIDLAFLTFTGASQYPNCFDFSPESRRERALASAVALLFACYIVLMILIGTGDAR